MRLCFESTLRKISSLSLALSLVAGCGGDEAAPAAPEGASEQKAPAAQQDPAKPEGGGADQAVPADKAAAEAAGGEEKPQKSLADLARDKLALTFTALYCAQRKNADADLLAIYNEHGYDTPVFWNKAWDKASKRKPEWAREVVSDAMSGDCTAADDSSAEEKK